MSALDRRLPLPSFFFFFSFRSTGLALALALSACHGDPPEPAAAPHPILESTTSHAVAAGGDDPTVVAPDADSTPAIGARDPLVIVTLFNDYQCPNCRRMHDVAQRILDRWPDDVQVQFRQLPLRGHPLARVSALTALAAHRQGRFACMSSALVHTRLQWTRLDQRGFLAFVERELVPHCGLAHERFMADAGDARLGAKIDADLQLARDTGVQGTPGALVDGFESRLWPRAGVPPANLLNAVVRRSLREAHARMEACRAGGTDCERAAIVVDAVYGNVGDSDITMRLLDLEAP